MNMNSKFLGGQVTAINDFSFEKIFLKIIGGEVASISKQTLSDAYEFKMPWWRAINDNSFKKNLS